MRRAVAPSGRRASRRGRRDARGGRVCLAGRAEGSPSRTDTGREPMCREPILRTMGESEVRPVARRTLGL